MWSHASKYAESVDLVMIFITGVSFLMLLGVTVAMVYFVIKYNRKKNPKAENIEGNTTLEIIWIVVPTLLVMVMFYFGYILYDDSRIVPKDHYTIKITGQMWKWTFKYSNGKTSDTLYVPVDKATKLDLNSVDVTHAFFIPALRIKEDVAVGKNNYMVIRPEKEGIYDVACAEYCGMQHSMMYTKLHVVSLKKYLDWVNDNPSEISGK